MGDFTLMATNNFKPFATAANANVTAQADWESLPALLSGFTAGKASSAQINKALRQASFIAAALAQYTSDNTGDDVLDDGDQAAFIAKMAAAFGKDFQPLDGTLTALAALTGAADKLPYFNGDDTAALTVLTAFAREILAQTDAVGVLSKLGLGDIATAGVGTGVLSGAGRITLPLIIGGVKQNLIIQWGNITTTAGSGPITFPLAFPTALLASFACEYNSSIWAPGNDAKCAVYGIDNKSRTGMRIASLTYSGGTWVNVNAQCQWLAMGY